MAPSVPPTWNIAVTIEAVASDTPVLLMRVGSQLDRRYITRRLEKNASQSNIVPTMRSGLNKWLTEKPSGFLCANSKRAPSKSSHQYRHQSQWQKTTQQKNGSPAICADHMRRRYTSEGRADREAAKHSRYQEETVLLGAIFRGKGN